MKIHIPYRAAHIAVFLLLAFLCYQAHQMARHLAGAALCGGFGSMTFTVATTRQPCSIPVLVTLSGPLLTYGLAYLGMLLMRSPRFALFAYALTFASFAHLRWIQNLTGRGDELVLAQAWFGVTSRALVAALVFGFGLPPLLAAWRAIADRRRGRVFAISWLLPLPVLFVLLVGDNLLFGPDFTGTRYGTIVGISRLVLLVDLVAAALFLWLAPRFIRELRQ